MLLVILVVVIPVIFIVLPADDDPTLQTSIDISSVAPTPDPTPALQRIQEEGILKCGYFFLDDLTATSGGETYGNLFVIYRDGMRRMVRDMFEQIP